MGQPDEPADGVDQAVEARGEHQRRDAEEGCRRHEVAGDGEAVLEPGDAAARCIEVGGGACPVRGPSGDAERRRHEQQEHRDGFGVERLPRTAFDHTGSMPTHGLNADARGGDENAQSSHCCALSMSVLCHCIEHGVRA